MDDIFLKFQRDIRGILWLGVAIFLSLALYSFTPTDPSFNSIGQNLKIINYCGYFGSFLADLLFQGLGLTAWILVLAALRMCLRSFNGKETAILKIRLLWGALLLITSSSLLALYFEGSYLYSNEIGYGGIIGSIISKSLVAVFNFAGVAIILWCLALVLIVFYTQQSLRDLFYWPSYALKRAISLPLWSEMAHFSRQSLRGIIERLQLLFKRQRPLAVSETVSTGVEIKESDFGHSFPLRGESVEGNEEEAPEETKKNIKSMIPFVGRKNKEAKRKVKLKAKVQRKVEKWELPKLSYLEDPDVFQVKVDEKEVRRKAKLLVEKLSQFSVKGEIVGVKTGPAVTLYEFKPNMDVRLSKITELADDLSLALSSESIRIIAPIPGRDVVGIETSNSSRETVFLKDLLAETSFWDEDIKLPIALGKEVSGQPVVVDLRKMPHLLVAGTTGSGKSVFTVSAITGLLFRHSPKTLKIILVDPKQVDLAAFSETPHLLMPPIRDPKKAVLALKWAIKEMEKRYRSMSHFGARSIEEFNEKVSDLDTKEVEGHEQLNIEMESDGLRQDQYYYEPQPYIAIVIEEFGDLMAVDKGNVEQAVVRLAQMARASGMHLILAMQSPRKDVITGLIKTNIPGRISFKVASKMDSRIILDESGAERLLARGDMLFLAPGVAKPLRHHGPWLPEGDIQNVIQHWKDQGEPEYDELAMKLLDGSGGGFDLGPSEPGEESEYDEMYDQILAWAAEQKTVSASLLQRRFRLGYPRAARMIELFEREGVVGPAQGSKPREVLVKSHQ